jgi:hypothetical protein
LGFRDGRIADDLDPISELHTLDQFWQLVVAVDPAPTLPKTVASAILFDRISLGKGSIGT